MWLNATAQTALRAVLCIAGQGANRPVQVDEIATALACPRNYLSKTLHALTRAGILRSTRGPKGGFQLSDQPDRVTLAQVVGPFDPPGERRCLLGRPTCGDADPCLVHDRWSKAAAVVENFFGRTTVADLLRTTGRPPSAEPAL